MSKEMLAGSSGSISVSVPDTTASVSAHQNNGSSSINEDAISVYQLKTLDVSAIPVDQLKTLSDDFIKKNCYNIILDRLIDFQVNSLAILARTAAVTSNGVALYALAHGDGLASITADDLRSMESNTLYWLAKAAYEDQHEALNKLAQGNCLKNMTTDDLKSMHYDTLRWLAIAASNYFPGALNALAQGDCLEKITSDDLMSMHKGTLVKMAEVAYMSYGHPEALNKLAQGECLKSLTAADLRSMNQSTLYMMAKAACKGYPEALNNLAQGDCLNNLTVAHLKFMPGNTLAWLAKAVSKGGGETLNKLAQSDCLNNLTAADLRSMAKDTLFSLAEASDVRRYPKALKKLAQGDCLNNLTAADLKSMDGDILYFLASAAYKGHPEALNKLAQGECLKSLTAADLRSMNQSTLYMMAKAACKGYPEALNNLAQGDCLNNLTAADLKSMNGNTLYWLAKAAIKGYPEALNKLEQSDCLNSLTITDLKSMEDRTLSCLAKAVNEGHPEPLNTLAEGGCLSNIHDIGGFFDDCVNKTISIVIEAALSGRPRAYRCLERCITSFVEEIKSKTDSDAKGKYDKDLHRISVMFTMVCERKRLMGDDKVLNSRKLESYLTSEAYKNLRSYLKEKGLCLVLQGAQYLESQNDVVAAKRLLLEGERISGECYSDKALTKSCFLKNYMLTRFDFTQHQGDSFQSETPERKKEHLGDLWMKIKWLRKAGANLVINSKGDDDYSEVNVFMDLVLHWVLVIKLHVKSDWFLDNVNKIRWASEAGLLSFCDSLDDVRRVMDIFIDKSFNTKATQTCFSLFDVKDKEGTTGKKRRRNDCGGNEASVLDHEGRKKTCSRSAAKH